MTARVPRLPFALDPLMAEAKRRARQRRFLIVVVVLALIGGAAGAAAVFRSPGGPQSSLPAALGGGSAQARGTVLAQYPRLGISFRYPAGWRRVDCSPAITNFGSRGVTYLTTARRAGCSPSASRRTRANGVAVLWQQAGVVVRHGGNARIGGQPAQVYLQALHAPSGVVALGPAPALTLAGSDWLRRRSTNLRLPTTDSKCSLASAGRNSGGQRPPSARCWQAFASTRALRTKSLAWASVLSPDRLQIALSPDATETEACPRLQTDQPPRGGRPSAPSRRLRRRNPRLLLHPPSGREAAPCSTTSGSPITN
jgi:hypothetical protein